MQACVLHQPWLTHSLAYWLYARSRCWRVTDQQACVHHKACRYSCLMHGIHDVLMPIALQFQVGCDVISGPIVAAQSWFVINQLIIQASNCILQI